MTDYLIDLAGGLLYGAEGLVLLVLGYYVIDLVTPGNLGNVLVEDRSRDAGVITAAALLGVGAIVSVAIWNAEGNLWQGLAQAGGYGVVGIVLMGISFKVIDVITPDRLGHIIAGEGDQPVTYMIAAALISLGAILAAAIS